MYQHRAVHVCRTVQINPPSIIPLPFLRLPTALSLSLFCAGDWAEQEEPEYPTMMLNKLSKQQQLLLQELERTKRRLREEIWAREGRTAIYTNNNALPTDPADPLALWSNHHARGADFGRSVHNANALVSPSSYQSNKRSSQVPDGRKGPNAPGGARLKRSRIEAGIVSPVENPTKEGTERFQAAMKSEEKSRAPPSTRIDMLPVMSSTGEWGKKASFRYHARELCLGVALECRVRS